MFITCQQCSTMYRLDENRLKPQGSKVRCSQCGNLFLAKPPAAEPPMATVADAPPVSAEPPPASPAAEDRELEGIDLAELDSIMEKGRTAETAPDLPAESQEETVEFNEADLDFDFETALEVDDAPAQVPQDAATEPAADDLELDLDMDFDLDDGDLDQPVEDTPESAPADIIPQQTIEPAAGQMGPDAGAGEDIDPGDGDLTEDVELALDDFEEALSLTDDSATAPGKDASTPQPDLEESDDLGIGDLGDLLDEADEPQEPREEVELSLDEDAEQSPAADSAAADRTAPDDLGLDDFGDLDQLLGDEDEPEPAPEEQELSLSDDTELELESGPEAKTAADSAADDLDLEGLDDLDALLDGDEPETDREEEDLSLSDDIELSLEDESAPTEQAGAPDAADDEFDLSDFDALLDEDTADAELELSLDDEPDPGSEDAAAAAVDAQDEVPGELEELEFELDAEFEDKPLTQTAGLEDSTAPAVELESDGDEELDLTDIEQMLEDDAIAPEPSAEPDDTAAVADGAEIWADDAADDVGLGGEEELDLSEIEEAIDAADSELEAGDALDPRDGDLELDLDLEEMPPGETTEAKPEEMELELEMESDSTDNAPQADPDVLDMSDLDFSLEDEGAASTTTETIDAGDIELEFEIDENGAASSGLGGEDTLVAAETAASATAPTGEAPAEEDFSAQDTVTTQPIVEKPPKKPVSKAAQKKGPGKSLVVLLILAILGGGGYYGWDYIVKNDIQIPYLSDYINPKPEDPNGIMNLSTLEINSKFIENEQAGRLFIVTGKVRNGYDVPCTMILLRGKLFTKGKKLAKTGQAYAGLTLTDKELTTLEITAIRRRLKTPQGQSKAIRVQPGQTAPFMVVFSELPPDLDEFAIELINSTKLQ